LPKKVTEFRAASTPIDINSRKAAPVDAVGVLFNERGREVEHFGQVQAFYKFVAFGKTFRLAHLELYQNHASSSRGLPRVSNEVYRTGRVVELAAFTRRVLLVRRDQADLFSFVLTLRHHLPLSYHD
jgi:hypothetical protein